MAATSCTIHSTFPTLLVTKSQAQMPVKRSTMICRVYGRETNSRHFGNNRQLVDESMITLRKRMHEMKQAEHNYEPPTEWMDWEKRYHMQYGTDVFELMGILQGLLINTRPSLALGIMGLFIISVSTSTILAVRLLIDICSFVFCHLNFLS
ncbi:hypothetical protein FCM35_KLT06038 [Carex littledalei]|uniref:Uncharacterized protein n=1 Tax=Carex littledalei TaxID=544730 RepID=A0A833QM16_9POAL|nr:hypothetical protein FCM35_KLT06038 [Carex littledalei]